MKKGIPMKAMRWLLCGAVLSAAVPALAQEPGAAGPDAPPRQRYLSDVRLHRESADVHVVGPKDDRLPRSPRVRGARPWPGPDVAYEVQPLPDGSVDASGWCFDLDPRFAGLANWSRCR